MLGIPLYRCQEPPAKAWDVLMIGLSKGFGPLEYHKY